MRVRKHEHVRSMRVMRVMRVIGAKVLFGSIGAAKNTVLN